MGDVSEFSLPVRMMLRAYRWRTIDPVPSATLDKPLSQCRLAVISSAGLVAPGQPRFDESIKGGDPSFREIPSDADVATLVDTHRSESFDHTGLARDPNLAFPIDRVRELAQRGRIASVNHRHFSFMGSLTATRRLTHHSAPKIAQSLVDDAVDIALLVPV